LKYRSHVDDFSARLDAIGRRLEDAAADPEPAGLTDADPDTPEERWQAAQVWAHLAEIVPYWQAQSDLVIRTYAGVPVPFGRTKRDTGRIAAIESGRHRPVAELVDATSTAVGGLRTFLDGLEDADWRKVGRHETLGEMDVDAIVERFLVAHLEEHLDQLEGLRASAE
jgi:hypothetical protein